MKKMIIFTLIFALLMGLTACGSSNENTAAPAEEAVSEAVVSEAEVPAEDSTMISELSTLEVVYYLDLGDGSMMAAAATEEGKAMMGEDYFVVLLDEAEIIGASGEALTLADLTRGSTLKIEWPGMVMMSYPAQVAAVTVTVLDNEIPADFPAEDQIPAVNDGPKWWESEPVAELPGLNVEYSTPDFSVAVMLGGMGTCTNAEGVTTAVEGQDPQEMTYDDNNTIKRVGFDTVSLVLNPAADTIVATAFVDGSSESVDVAVAEDGSMELVDGNEVIYVVSAFWNAEDFSGDATYAFKVVVPAE